MAKFLSAILFVVLFIGSGCSRDFEEVKLRLYGLILPGKTASNGNIVAKYVWQGGGNLREIARVNVDYNGNMVSIRPYGLLDLRERAFPDDIFWRTDTVSLGVLPTGSYTIKLVGETFTYYDTLIVPTDVPDSLFQFDITVISQETGNIVTNIPIALEIYSSPDTVLRDTTNSSGLVMFTYANPGFDSLSYYLFNEANDQQQHFYFGQTHAELGVPEVITVGMFKYRY